MTPDPFDRNPADDGTGTRDTTPGPAPHPFPGQPPEHVTPPVLDAPPIPLAPPGAGAEPTLEPPVHPPAAPPIRPTADPPAEPPASAEPPAPVEASATAEPPVHPPVHPVAEPPAEPWAQPAAERTAGAPVETPAEVPVDAATETAAEPPHPPTAGRPAAGRPTDGTPASAEPPTAAEVAATVSDENGEEAIRTLLWTAATERPVPEVAALVARLKESGELSSPADVALRAAAVSRPLDEVRQLVALLNESGYDLHQAETTLRAAAVGRPIEDIVELVNIIGADGMSWRALGGGEADGQPAEPAPSPEAPAEAVAVAQEDPSSKRLRGALKSAKSPLDHALAAGPGSHAPSPALRSALRWPAAAALFACGLIHLPTDVADLRSGGSASMVSVVVTVFCLLCGVWLAARDTASAWAASAAGTVGLIALHVLAGARTVDLLQSSLGSRFAWAQALAVLCGAAVIALAAAALLRHTKATGAADGT
ncbi:hypothetical protein ABZ135_00025 [Streptomyces sp. NPDC006339]|uniref:hypothetical protein n=1 Tax=Streptomyces sp. NPDC006339 TaxID=3156755 RepID=UPI0033AFD07A